MADILQVTPEQLQQTAQQFKTYQSQLQTAYLKMSNTVRRIDAIWNGEASEQFKAQFDSMYKNLEQTEQKMQDGIDELLKAHDTYLTTEQAIQKTTQQLETGTSPFV